MHTNWAYRLDCLTDSDAARGWKAHFDNAFLRAKQSAQENLESSSPGIILADKLNTKPFFPSIVKCFSVLDHSSEPAFRRDPVLCLALSNQWIPTVLGICYCSTSELSDSCLSSRSLWASFQAGDRLSGVRFLFCIVLKLSSRVTNSFISLSFSGSTDPEISSERGGLRLKPVLLSVSSHKEAKDNQRVNSIVPSMVSWGVPPLRSPPQSRSWLQFIFWGLIYYYINFFS